MLGQARLRDQRPVGQMPGRLRRAVTQQLLANAAPAAIGAHQQVAAHHLVIGQLQRHIRVGLLKTDHRTVQMQRRATLLLQRRQQQHMQVGPVDGVVRRAVALGKRITQAQHAQLRASDGAAHLQPVWAGHHGLQGVLQAPSAQDFHHVGAQLNTGAKLRKLGAALEQRHFCTRTGASQSGTQATNSTACNQHFAHQKTRFTM